MIQLLLELLGLSVRVDSRARGSIAALTAEQRFFYFALRGTLEEDRDRWKEMHRGV